jgi:hypothetical protein
VTGGFRPDLLYLGWQAQARQDPGPPPRRPPPPELDQLDPGWLAAQRREQRRVTRPAAAASAAAAALAVTTVALGLSGALSPALAGLAATALTAGCALGGRVIWRCRRDLARRIGTEERRVATARAALAAQHVAAQQAHAEAFRRWQAGHEAARGARHWHPVTLPTSIDRLDVAGGTLSGWSALLTTLGLPRLAGGGEVTVVDLSEGAAGQDLAGLAAVLGAGPLVWLLPGDLAWFDLGTSLPAAELADVLAVSASPGPPAAGPDPAAGQVILARLLEVLGEGALVGQVIAGLRALGQIGDPRADVGRGLLRPEQVDQISRLFGRGAAERVVIERAWALEARLRVLEGLGSETVPLSPASLRVVAVDPRAGGTARAVLSAYVVAALSQLLRHAPRGRPWRHTLFLAGAGRLPGELVDRLARACETTRTGLVLCYDSLPPAVRERLGRGNAALAVMRLGNAEDAKAAAEQIGTEHRLVISQFTETVGASVSDTEGGSYTSTVGAAVSSARSVSVSETAGLSRGHGRTRADPAPFGPRTGSSTGEASRSRGSSDSESVTEQISSGTSWGVTTSRALGWSGSLTLGAQRSREFLVEPHALQRLAPSAVIVSYAGEAGRQVVLADANPAILTLPTARVPEPAPTGGHSPARVPGPAPTGGHSPAGAAGPPPARPTAPSAGQVVSWQARQGRPPPNLGPPPQPLDWRAPRRRGHR